LRVFHEKKLQKHRIATGKYTSKSFDGHKGGIYALQVDRDNVVTASGDKTIRVWDINTLECKQVLKGEYLIY
jgi:F-box and WD-40 domain protein 1/11